MKPGQYGNYIVFLIDDTEKLGAIRDDWKRIYKEDTGAHLFVSWEWMSNWLTITKESWFILVMRDNNSGEVVSIFPLAKKSSGSRWNPVRLVTNAGLPLAMYNDMITMPGCKGEVLNLWAAHFQANSSWDKFIIKGAWDPQFNLFADHFKTKKYKLSYYPGVDSLSIDLPADWEVYHREILGQRTRKTLNRLFNKIDRLGIVLHETAKENYSKDIDTLLHLWQKKWGNIKGIEEHRIMLRKMYECGQLWLYCLMDSDRPVSAQACLIDREKKTVYAYITAYDAEYANLSPGNLIGLTSLKRAISEGFNSYDFLLGNDKYKQTLGAVERPVLNLTIEKLNFRTLQTRVLRDLTRLVKPGK